MTDTDLHAKLQELQRLHAAGILTADLYRAALKGLGQDPDTTFDQREQQVQQQVNVAGDYISQQAAQLGAPPAVLRQAYLYRLLRQTRGLPLSGVDRKAAEEEDNGEVQLAAVYTALLTQRPEHADLLDARHTAERETRYLSAVEMLDHEKYLVLLGEPGSGKTTFINFVALCLAGEALDEAQANLAALTIPLPDERPARERRRDDKEPQPQPWEHGALLPVRVVLRDFVARGLPETGARVNGKTLWDFIAAELGHDEYAPHLKRELLERGGLILLDGLDEVPEAQHRRAQVKAAVQGFADDFPHCRFLVTSRTYAYQRQDWKLRGFAEAVLAPFTPEQITRFVERWYAHVGQVRDWHPDHAQGQAVVLKTAIERSERLAELATRPLLLTLMASLHAWRGGSLPEKREQLYADTVDLLLDWWERPKVVRDKDRVIVQQPSLAEWLQVDRDQVRALLERLAYAAHAGQPGLVGTADVPEGDLLSGLLRLSRNPEVNPARLVEYLSQRAGLLLPRGVGMYAFPHRTFQEYLAACYLTDHEYPDEVAELARAEPNRWREVALLAGAKAARGTASAVWSLVDALCYTELSPGDLPEADAYGALLAGQALVESASLENLSPRNQQKVTRVRAHLALLLDLGGLNTVERAKAGVLLGQLGDPRPGVGLREEELPEIVWCEVPAGPFLMGSSDKDERAYSDEKPQHTFEVPALYYMSRYPVTQAQYAAFVAAGGYTERWYWMEAQVAGYWQAGRFKGNYDDEPRSAPVDYGEPFNLPNHPVVGVSWYEAVAFCRWLETKLQVASCRLKVWRATGVEVVNLQPETFNLQLPSEAEWEKAARGGPPSPDRRGAGSEVRRYPWGEETDPERANYEGTGIGATSAVGAFPGGASPYGMLDLSGNVWEWCRTKWEGDYKQYRHDDDLEGTRLRVVRGGAFYDDEWRVRCASRGNRYPNYRSQSQGFRLVLSPSALNSVL